MKENEALRYANEQLTSNVERLQEEVNDMQSNEEKFMIQVYIFNCIKIKFIYNLNVD